MLMYWNMANKQNLWGFYRLFNKCRTYSLLNLNCKQKFYPSYNVVLAPAKLTCHNVKSLLGNNTFKS